MSDIPNLSAQCKVITPSSPEYDKAIARSTLTAVIPAKYVVYPSTPSDFTEDNDSKTSLALWEFHPPGRNTEINVKDTAYPSRKQQNYFVVYGLHTSPERDTPTREWIEKAVSKVNNANLEKMGFKFPIPSNTGTGLEAPEDIYGENLQRLRELKTKYDPQQVFNKKHWAIPPLTSN